MPRAAGPRALPPELEVEPISSSCETAAETLGRPATPPPRHLGNRGAMHAAVHHAAHAASQLFSNGPVDRPGSTAGDGDEEAGGADQQNVFIAARAGRIALRQVNEQQGDEHFDGERRGEEAREKSEDETRAADELEERAGARGGEPELGEGARPPREGRDERDEREGGGCAE